MDEEQCRGGGRDNQGVTLLWLNHHTQAAGLEAAAFPSWVSPAVSDGRYWLIFFQVQVKEYL